MHWEHQYGSNLLSDGDFSPAQWKFKLQEWCVDELMQGSLPTLSCIFYEASKWWERRLIFLLEIPPFNKDWGWRQAFLSLRESFHVKQFFLLCPVWPLALREWICPFQRVCLTIFPTLWKVWWLTTLTSTLLCVGIQEELLIFFQSLSCHTCLLHKVTLEMIWH